MFGFGSKDKSHAMHGHGGMEMSHPQSDSGAKTVLRVEGMTCMHCKMSVEKALKSVDGVESADVDLMKKEAVVKGSAPRDTLVKAVEDAGYSVVA